MFYVFFPHATAAGSGAKGRAVHNGLDARRVGLHASNAPAGAGGMWFRPSRDLLAVTPSVLVCSFLRLHAWASPLVYFYMYRPKQGI